MKHTQIEPKSTLENHQKNPAKNQMVMRCKIILLKQAIQRAEMSILKQMRQVPLSNIETAIGYTSDAGRKTVIALQDGFLSCQLVDEIRDALYTAFCYVHISEVSDAWGMAIEIGMLMPLPEVKHGIPRFVIKDNPIPAFDNQLVTGDVKYGGESHRCVDIARELLRRKLWDGISKIHICGNVSEIHRRVFFLNENPEVASIQGRPSNEFYCYIDLNDVPVNDCKNHAKGGWTDFDENGKRKFVMPPYPGVDEICPDCGGYLPQERGAK